MNIDDVKDAWNSDEPKGMNLPDNTAMLGKTTSIVEGIRKNMKSEFIAQLVSYLVLILFLFKGSQSSFFFNIACILFFIIVILNIYYFSRFYIFYKSISRYDFSIKESIRKIVYELELNTEVYKTYNFSVAPLAVLATIALIGSKGASDVVQHILAANASISMGNMLIVFAVILISFLLTYLGINFHIKLQFGKRITELKQLMDDLGDEG